MQLAYTRELKYGNELKFSVHSRILIHVYKQLKYCDVHYSAIEMIEIIPANSGSNTITGTFAASSCISSRQCTMRLRVQIFATQRVPVPPKITRTRTRPAGIPVGLPVQSRVSC